MAIAKHTLTITKNDVSDLTGYQVRIDENSTGFSNIDFDRILADGADVRFYADVALTTALDFEIETWDDTAKTFTIWVEVATDDTEIFMTYDDSTLSDASSGANTFPDFFDHFTSSDKYNLPIGSDSGWSCGFDPTSRRFFFFGLETDGSRAWAAVPWTNLDTGDVGFAKKLPATFNKRSVVYNPDDSLFYLYGGRDDSGTKTDKIVTYNPATDSYVTLSETLPAAAITAGQTAVHCPTNGKIYLFGFDGANILIHDITAGTVTDTSADMPIGSFLDISCVWSSENSRIYLIGGGNSVATALDNVDVYDPANESTNPIASGVTLSEGKTTTAVAAFTTGGNTSIYVFGGFRSDVALYSAKIEKITVNGGSETIATLTATLPKADDDAIAFYDATLARIIAGPFIHSSGSTNEHQRKLILLTLDPTDDTLDSEPSLGSVPTNWTNDGTGVPIGASFGSQARVVERSPSQFVRLQRDGLAFTPTVYAVEFRVNPMTHSPQVSREDNYQVFVRDSSSAIGKIQNIETENWYLFNGSNPGTLIAALSRNTYQLLTLIVDEDNEELYAQVDRGTKVGPIAFQNLGITPSRVWMGNSTDGSGGFVVDWAKARSVVVGTEPTVEIGSLVEGSGKFAMGEVYHPGFQKGEVYHPGFQKGQKVS